MGFVLVADKKFGFSVRNQRNLSFFSTFRWFLTGNAGYFFSLNAKDDKLRCSLFLAHTTCFSAYKDSNIFGNMMDLSLEMQEFLIPQVSSQILFAK